MFRVAHLVTCLLLLAAVAASRSGNVLGHRLHPAAAAPVPAAPAADGAVTVDTSAMAPAAMGYGGPVPVKVSFADGRVASVAPVLPNDETPMFFARLDEERLWSRWDGLSAAEAADAPIDAVTGATYSSKAAIASVRAAARAYAAAQGGATGAAPEKESPGAFPARAAAASLVLLAAALLPLLTRSRMARTALLALDVAVIGFWSGTYLSFARLAGWAANGLPSGFWDAAPAALALAMAFLFPLFGRPGHYCLNACPFGAAQELAGRLSGKKAALPAGAVRALAAFRRLLWVALVALLWLDISDAWLNLELFGAFAWRAAPPALLAAAALVLALSVFVARPYCRFVCPTGMFLKLAEFSKGDSK